MIKNNQHHYWFEIVIIRRTVNCNSLLNFEKKKKKTSDKTLLPSQLAFPSVFNRDFQNPQIVNV